MTGTPVFRAQRQFRQRPGLQHGRHVDRVLRLRRGHGRRREPEAERHGEKNNANFHAKDAPEVGESGATMPAFPAAGKPPQPGKPTVCANSTRRPARSGSRLASPTRSQS